jgi:hypothetical protein
MVVRPGRKIPECDLTWGIAARRGTGIDDWEKRKTCGVLDPCLNVAFKCFEMFEGGLGQN